MKPVGVQRALVEHEAHQAAVADRRDHALGDPLGGAGDHRRLALAARSERPIWSWLEMPVSSPQ